MVALAGLLFVYVFLQVGIAAVLLQLRGRLPLGRAILAVLFLLNAGITVIAVLEVAGYAGYETYLEIFLLRYALDVPTAGLLLAFLFARRETPRDDRIAYVLLGVGALHAMLSVLFPAITLAENNADVVLRALPFYGSLAAFVLVLSRGETWERWIALAFLSRAFYFGVSGPHRLPFALSGAALPWEIPNSIALIALLLVTLYASYRLLSDERQPTSSIVLPVLGVAPLVAAAEIAMASQPVGNVMALNLVTLAAVRPLLVCMAFSPARLPALLGRSLVAAGVTTSVFFLLSANGIRNGPDIVLGLAAGLMSLAVLEVWHPGIGQTRHTDFGAPAQPDPSSPGPGSAGARPSWQRILLELRGSSVPPDERPLGDPRFRQKPVADRAKVSVQRVSEFPERMNDSAAQRLDVFVPGWRARHLAGPPVLVQTFKGAVEGLPGTWIYYRLTPLGEQLAAAVAEKPADEAAPETRLF